MLKISGLVGVETTREEMKTVFEGQGVAWVTFNKGDPEAFIRSAFLNFLFVVLLLKLSSGRHS